MGARVHSKRLAIKSRLARTTTTHAGIPIALPTLDKKDQRAVTSLTAGALRGCGHSGFLATLELVESIIDRAALVN